MASGMPTINRRSALKTLGATGATLTLAGCIGDEEDDTITVGASLALTGPLAQEGSWQERGYELWVQTLNEEGGWIEPNDEPGLLGREVELIVYDDESDPQRGVDLYQRLIEEDDVDILMGPYGSGISSAVIPIIEQAGMASVLPLMSDATVLREQDIDYVSQLIAPAETYLVGAIDIAVEHGAETAAIIYEDTAFPTDVAEGHIPYIEEQGLELVDSQPYPEDTEDYTGVLSPIADQDVDVVLGGGYTPDAIGLTRAAESLGYEPGIFALMVAGTIPAFEEAVGDSVHGMSGDLFWDPRFDVPYIDDLIDLTAQEYDDVEDGWDIQSHLAGGFSGGLLFEKAVKQVGEIDQDAIATEMRAIDTREEDWGIPWANGEYAVNDDGLQLLHRPGLGQWQEQDDGSMGVEAVWPGDVGTADPVYPHPGW